MNYYNANNEDNINVKNNKGLDQVPDSPEADLKRLFNPAMVVEDTVPKQTSEQWEDLTQLLDKFQTIFSQKTNRPQCNGKNERVNQTLVAKSRCKVNSTTKTPWTKLLEQVTYGYNNSPHDVTGFPPAYLMFGTLPYDSPLPNQVKLSYPPIQQAIEIAVNRTIKHHKINKQREEMHRGGTTTKGTTGEVKGVGNPTNVLVPGMGENVGSRKTDEHCRFVRLPIRTL
ncbi:retrotransposable element Tf2 protein type 1 [Trichonephila clavipes]|uniref:Retrotransposable element Tf2 protein type 1 n=1 Tax=Trichonephila clavipes TaxID=2585209 RepID=A0A8X6RA55_TRICX|nr:retrotransposable element Tf2 protein type 1 [Trichonephila clavipes]